MIDRQELVDDDLAVRRIAGIQDRDAEGNEFVAHCAGARDAAFDDRVGDLEGETVRCASVIVSSAVPVRLVTVTFVAFGPSPERTNEKACATVPPSEPGSDTDSKQAANGARAGLEDDRSPGSQTDSGRGPGLVEQRTSAGDDVVEIAIVVGGLDAEIAVVAVLDVIVGRINRFVEVESNRVDAGLTVRGDGHQRTVVFELDDVAEIEAGLARVVVAIGDGDFERDLARAEQLSAVGRSRRDR